jgi:hypothetical protein
MFDDIDTIVIDVPPTHCGLGDVALPFRFPTAMALLRLWHRPWSGAAIRQCAHRLALLDRLGLPGVLS